MIGRLRPEDRDLDLPADDRPPRRPPEPDGKILIKTVHVWFGYGLAANLAWRLIWAFNRPAAGPVGGRSCHACRD
jgi:hypothetical protein